MFRSILITGANRGLGLEFVKQFVNYEPKVETIIAVCRNPGNAQELTQVSSANENVTIIELDVRDYSKYDQSYEKIASIVGDKGLDLLINNAGIALRGNLDVVEPKDMMENFEVNVVAPLMFARKLIPLIKPSQAKLIVNISSELGSIANSTGGMYPYKTSKAALNMVTKCMAEDLKQQGISCIALHPGWVVTDMGGPKAHLKVDQSISQMIQVIRKLDINSTGSFLSFNGDTLPW
ncbi:C-factor-like [Panonychus citri]|uniref:C-factor-like n=1 Tax=Panonychus citri TaxID=50023 RepID=UPI0023073EB9|nr:C-factor-like [Panonychus citri]